MVELSGREDDRAMGSLMRDVQEVTISSAGLQGVFTRALMWLTVLWFLRRNTVRTENLPLCWHCFRCTATTAAVVLCLMQSYHNHAFKLSMVMTFPSCAVRLEQWADIRRPVEYLA
ncbi:hypothetical protein T440DRAFT_154878 [Plenodomus tracheiphilus IPT5]|uniref:Uncharacterized protein n=1 Tax=Plenodomus tracheiphilus IPT5 TaxID=1408161 RepID=A0A6A7BJ04_9PLEO|nr:hypothetical protein T440DRAFT_154878 [Plenodomus tracheiphilus IPT5]